MNLTIFPNSKLNKDGKKHIVINNVVFDVTAYAARHPGGMTIMKSPDFDSIQCLVERHGRNMAILEKRLKELAVGRLQDPKQIPEVDKDSKVYQLIIRLFPSQ